MAHPVETLAIIGAGSVGSAIAYAATIDRLADHITLYDTNAARAEAETLDLRHGLQFVGGGRVSGGDDIGLCDDADLVVVTAGATHSAGGSRLDLATSNARLVRELMPRLVERAPDAIYLFVTNPVDVVTYLAQEIGGLPPERLFGSGTVLDSSRLRHLVAERLGVSVTSIHATVIGEHGDSELVLWSSATVGGAPVFDVVGPEGGRIDRSERQALRDEVRGAAGRIIAGKGNTNLAIGLATTRIVRAIARDERAVLPVSVRVDVDGVGPVCLAVPSIVGRAGVVGRVPVPMDDDERAAFRASATTLREVLDALT